ncbi:sugar phosphate isomerase/epimerase [Solirubrobacter phytolaccae]|uniref:Sugar phosphate isomerase/epimerase n=1 Tax=Solirubrobacter phytolaccae TaxID=1404360 RepID=A0A9X3N5T9_9ACTN|nr:sugar phosphate isomerase/epimerase [Solirubrobacter phytolaccae]MDA0180415.1 sugar phosphate isomerase/epimerase [Solirubrobacter phytolaccae]
MSDEQRGLGRRDFLLGAAGAAAVPMGLGALGVPGAVAKGGGDHGHGGGGSIPREQISIQLYTVRDQLAADLDGTLRALARIGYRTVEHAGFHGRTAAEFKAALRRAGIKATSGHQSVPWPFDAAAWRTQLQDAVTVGQRYIVTPVSPATFGPGGGTSLLTTAADWKAYAAALNQAGYMARQYGLRFGFHNHNWEFGALQDDTPLVGFDFLISDTDPRLVHFELDLYWAWYAHRDPVQLIAMLGDRVKQFHVKDMKFNPGHVATFTDPGTGVIDFARIFRAAGDPREHEYIVERDDALAVALNTAQVGFSYLSRIRF